MKFVEMMKGFSQGPGNTERAVFEVAFDEFADAVDFNGVDLAYEVYQLQKQVGEIKKQLAKSKAK